MKEKPVYFLLVDDLPQNLIALETLLKRDGLVLLNAGSGPEALELLLQYDIALALVDVQMPDMDGFELAELMRGAERTRRVPIIFLTAGNSDQKRRFQGYEAGAVDFLNKPIETDVLRSKADIFFELYRQRAEVERQRDELAEMISENRRLLEVSRQYSEALKRTDRHKDEFLATLAHELRNPLAPILNSIQVIQLATGPQNEHAHLHRIVERQVKHIVRLVDDLLDVSRITNGKIRLQLACLDVAEAMHNAAETNRPLFESARQTFVLNLPSQSLHVEGDMVRLTQILANLLNNASKYTPEGGFISLTAQHVEGWAQISVKDTGLGIPTAMLSNVFEMFTQINRHLKRSQGGLGIGLTLVKRLVELHGGTVSVASEGEGLGTEFLIRLPAATRVAVDEPESQPSFVSLAAAERILVIDDNEDCLSSLKILLDMYGHEVHTAKTGAHGLQMLPNLHPSVVILDLGMADMDGYETARRLRGLREGRELLLIALTGWGQEQDRTLTQEAGFDYHLVKPVGPRTLQELLEKHAAERAARPVGQPDPLQQLPSG